MYWFSWVMTSLNEGRLNVWILCFVPAGGGESTTLPSHCNGTLPFRLWTQKPFHKLLCHTMQPNSISTYFYLSVSIKHIVFKCAVYELMIFTFGRVPSLDITPINDVDQKKKGSSSFLVFILHKWPATFSWVSSVIFRKHIFGTRNYKIICSC
jgi:hypothetical protein